MTADTEREIKSFIIAMIGWAIILHPENWWQWIVGVIWSWVVSGYLADFIKKNAVSGGDH